MDADSAPRHAVPQAHDENSVQWGDLTVAFSPEHTRAGDCADAPIGLLMDADDVATNAVAAVQMDAAKARAVGGALVWFAARLDAESGTDHRGDRVTALQDALAVALDALGRAALVCASQPRIGRDAATLQRIARELRDSHAAARRIAGVPAHDRAA